MEPEAAATEVGIHKLPREITDLIWPHASPWPTGDDWSMANIGSQWLVPGSALVCWCFPLPTGGYRMPYFNGRLSPIRNEDSLGMATVIYTLSPPPIAQVCRETRAFALSRFGLDEDTSEGKRKMADPLSRWENEYMVTVIFANCMTFWPGDHSHRLDMKACLSSAKFTCNQLILDLAALHGRYIKTDPSDRKHEPENPLLRDDWIGSDVFDLLSIAEDDQILVAYPKVIQLIAPVRESRFLRQWVARKSRYVKIDDAVVFGALSSMGLKPAPIPASYDPAKYRQGLLSLDEITELGPKGREILKGQALKPFRQLWEKRRWEQPPPLKPFPKVDVVIALTITRRGKPVPRWPFCQDTRSTLYIDRR